MIKENLHKTQTGIACEYFVAGELSRRGYNVTLTSGNTKAIDLLIEKNKKLIPIQVKGIQRIKSICWNISEESIREDIIYVLVNLNADSYNQPEYFVLTSEEMDKHLKRVKSGRHYIDYNYVKRMNFIDSWDKI